MKMGKIKEDVGKIYWKIGEVAKALNVATSNLRFWESEFRWIRVKKGKTGIRMYTSKTMQQIIDVHILTRNGMTLEGVKKAYEEDYFQTLVEFFIEKETMIRNGELLSKTKVGYSLYPKTKEESHGSSKEI